MAELDEEGFLINHHDWSIELAQQIALSHGIKALTSAHIRVILFLRNDCNRYLFIPPPRLVCRRLQMEGYDIKGLFGNCLNVWQIAGLPYPGDKVKAFLK